MLGVSMGGIWFLRTNTGSLCLMPMQFMMSHLKRCLSSYLFHADINTVTGMQPVDLWQTHIYIYICCFDVGLQIDGFKDAPLTNSIVSELSVRNQS